MVINHFSYRPVLTKTLIAAMILIFSVVGLQVNKASAAVPKGVYALDDIVQIDGNYALDKSGILWGLNDKIYKAIAVTDQVKAFSSNGSAIKTDGSVWTRDGSTYTQVKGLPASNAVEGNYVIDTLGNVWSVIDKKKIPELKNIVKLDDGEYDTALDKDGNVWIWGFDSRSWYDSGIPNETFGPDIYFKNIRHLQGGIAIDNNWKVINIWRNIYLKTDNVIVTDIDLSTISQSIKDVFVHSIADDTSHSYVLKNDGTVWTWGESESSNLQQIKGLSNVVAVSGKESGGTALYKNGHVSSWSGAPKAAPTGKQQLKEYSVNPLEITTHIGVRVDGELKVLPSYPLMYNNRVYVPVRGLFESLGGTVSYSNDIVKVSYNYHQVEMKVWSTEAVIDSKKVKLDTPAQIMNGKTMVPLRFIGQSLGANVKWDAVNRIVELS